MNHFRVIWPVAVVILACVLSSSVGETASYRSTSYRQDAAAVYVGLGVEDVFQIWNLTRLRRSIFREARKRFTR